MSETRLKTYRVKTYVHGYQTWEVNAVDERDASEGYALGQLVYDDLDYDVEVVVQIDTAEVDGEKATP